MLWPSSSFRKFYCDNTQNIKRFQLISNEITLILYGFYKRKLQIEVLPNIIYIENHCIYEVDKFGEKSMHIVNLHELTKSEELFDFQQDDIKHTIAKLLEGDYIKGNLIPKNSGVNFEIVLISQLTLKGHDLLDNIRPEPVWNKTKNVLQKVGDFSLGIMSQIAGESMAAYTKSMMNLN